MTVNLKIGVHTMMWGTQLTMQQTETMLQEICDVASEFGISTVGIDFGQNIHSLGVELKGDDIRRAEWIAHLFYKDYMPKPDGKPIKLKLLSFSGRSSLGKRIAFCELLHKVSCGQIQPEFLPIQQWLNSYAETAVERVEKLGTCLALHPLRFSPVEKTNAIAEVLSSMPFLKFLPNTAHLWLANRRTLDWIIDGKLIKNEIRMELGKSDSPPLIDRIIAVHLKDWKRPNDTSLRFFSKGFSELGDGYISRRSEYQDTTTDDSDLGRFCSKIINYPGGFPKWCIIEQDHTPFCMKDSIFRSLYWLKNGISFQENLNRKTPQASIFINSESQQSQIISPYRERMRQVVNELHNLNPHNPGEYAASLNNLLRFLFDTDHLETAIWEYSPRISAMVLLNDKDDYVSSIAHRTCVVQSEPSASTRILSLKHHFELLEHDPLLSNYSKELYTCGTERRFDMLVSVPVANSYHFNNVDLRVDVFLNESYLPSINHCGESDEVGDYDLSIFDDLIPHISDTIEKMWDRIANQFKNKAISEAYQCRTSEDMMRVLLLNFEEHFSTPCDDNGEETKASWSYYEKIAETNSLREVNLEGHRMFLETTSIHECVLASENKDFVISLSNLNLPSNTTMTQKDNCNIQSVIAFPLMGASSIRDNIFHVFGIVCGRRLFRAFTLSDEKKIRELRDAFVPLLYNRLASERRAQSIRFLRHELAHPISAFENMSKTLRKTDCRTDGIADAIDSYANVLKAILDSSFFVTGESQPCNRTDSIFSIIDEIILPVIRQSLLLMEKRMGPDLIREIRRNSAVRIFHCMDESGVYYDSRNASRKFMHNKMIVSKSHLIMVFSNLMINSLKYSNRLPVARLGNDYSSDMSDSMNRRIQIDILVRNIAETDRTFPGGMEVLFRDFGYGVPFGSEEYIFQDGARASNQANVVTGDGMGLYVARAVLADHKGVISLTHNELPTEFCVRFPRDIFTQ